MVGMGASPLRYIAAAKIEMATTSRSVAKAYSFLSEAPSKPKAADEKKNIPTSKSRTHMLTSLCEDSGRKLHTD